MPEPRRVGILGAGFIAPFHLKALQRADGVEAVAICDLAEDRARALAAGFGVGSVHTDLDTLLETERLDALHVLLPPHLHFESASRAIAAGVHVLVEKPLTTRVEEAEALAELAETAGVRLATSHNFLFTPAYERFRRWVRGGHLGALDEIDIVWQKPLDLLHHGPFDTWMLRDPGNIALEVAPHSFAHQIDLCPDAGEPALRCDDRIRLPSGQPFHRRFELTAQSGRTRVRLRFGFGDGYSTHLIRARGSVASAEVDFEANRVTLNRHRPYGLDLDRLAASVSEGFGGVYQGLRTFAEVALGKARVGSAAAPFEASIERSVGAFYRGLSEPELDSRHAAPLSVAVVRTGCETAERLRAEAPPVATPAKPTPAPEKPDTLVLGGTGFIGRALVRRLCKAGRSVRLLVRRRSNVLPELTALGVDVVEGDLRDAASLASALEGISHVFHLARGYGETWAEVLASDVEPTRKLGELCIEHGVQQLVYASSIVIYDAGDPTATIRESTPADPELLASNLYARGKAACESALLALHREHGLPVVIVRPGIVIGAGSSPAHYGIGNWPFPGLCDVWGDGYAMLPLVLVEDVADGMALCAETPGIEGEGFNLVGPPLLTARDYLDELERASGTRIQRRFMAPDRSHGIDWLKWAVKSALGLPARSRPARVAARARTAASRFDCRHTQERLGWAPASDRQTLVEAGIEAPVRDWSA